MLESGTDAAANAHEPQEPPPPLPPPVFIAATPGPSKRALRSRWAGPAWCTCMVLAFAVSGYSWTLRPIASEHAPGAAWQWNLARAAFAACAALALVCLWVTHAADPGFITPRCARAARCVVRLRRRADAAPRSVTPDAEFAAVCAGRARGEALGWRTDAIGQWVRGDGAKFCTTCHVWRPPRASHCAECGFCVARHDHHCGVMGTCVAQRNHAPFAAFLCAVVAGAVILLAATAQQLYAMRWPWTAGAWRRWETYPHAVLLVFYVYPCFLVGFAGMHVGFVCRDYTTHQMIAERRRKSATAMAARAGQPAAPQRDVEADVHHLQPAPPAPCGASRVCCLAFRPRRAFEEAWALAQLQHAGAPLPPGAHAEPLQPDGSAAEGSDAAA